MLQNAVAAGATRVASAAPGKAAAVLVLQIRLHAAANQPFWCCILQHLLELLLEYQKRESHDFFAGVFFHMFIDSGSKSIITIEYMLTTGDRQETDHLTGRALKLDRI